jgi:hypothetical protein
VLHRLIESALSYQRGAQVVLSIGLIRLQEKGQLIERLPDVVSRNAVCSQFDDSTSRPGDSVLTRPVERE